MTTTYTSSETESQTYAEYLASKVAADLHRIRRIYGKPSENEIQKYRREMEVLLKHRYIQSVYYGFRKGDEWISPTLFYDVDYNSTKRKDDSPGRVPLRGEVEDARFYSFLLYSLRWGGLSSQEQKKFIEEHGIIERTMRTEPSSSGLSASKTYSYDGIALHRSNH